MTEEQKAEVERLRAQRCPIRTIVAKTGIPWLAIRQHFSRSHKRVDYWTDAELKIVFDGVAAKKTYRQIVNDLQGRSIDSVRHIISYHKAKKAREYHKTHGALSFIVPPKVWDERNERMNEYRTPAQILMGDPPFSQSALGRCQTQP